MKKESSQSADQKEPRWKYLHSTLRLDHDPFAVYTAELDADPRIQHKDIRRKIEEDPPFYEYFVDPPYEVINSSVTLLEEGASLLNVLLEPRPVVVYGLPGTGKTFLRLQVEHEARARYEYRAILAVSHNLGKGPQEGDPTASLAIDLFIQTVERFEMLHTTDEALRARLWRFWQIHAPDLTNVLVELLSDQTVERALTGVARWWWRLERPVVPNTPLTPSLKQFLMDTLDALQSNRHTGEKACSLMDGLELATLLGFQHVYFLIDAAGISRYGFVAWQHTWQQLQNQIVESKTLPFYFKYFLPPFFQSVFQPEDLPPETISVILSWDNLALEKLIANRFRSARRWMRNFNAVSTIPNLNAQMIAAAGGSPRRLVQIASALIDAHASRASEAPFISVEDWHEMQREWGYSPPIPNPLEKPEQQKV